MLPWLYGLVAVATALQAASRGSNVFGIYRDASLSLLAGRELYALSPTFHDYFLYSPTFALLFAPIALLPLASGMLVWNALNAGALYWGLGRALPPDHALAARAIVLVEMIGPLQNLQSNVLVTGLMLLSFASLERRETTRAAIALGVATFTKIFPIALGVMAIFNPRRLPRFALSSAALFLLLLAAPLVVVSPTQLVSLYQSWLSVERADAAERGYSVMHHLHLWFGVDWPNWPLQLLGMALLLAPLVRRDQWDDRRFRAEFLSSVLMFCVLFNHASESPTFIIAITGVAVWFVARPRGRISWELLALVYVGTVLSGSDVMPRQLRDVIGLYRLKTFPILLVWLFVQWELWTMRAGQSASAALHAPDSARAVPAT